MTTLRISCGMQQVCRRRSREQALFDPEAASQGGLQIRSWISVARVFLEKLAGVARLQRCLSGFIEAYDSHVSDSGGVKNDRVAPSPKALTDEIGSTVGAAEGFGNGSFSNRTEYTAKRNYRLFQS